jgi:lipoic acid synthetase
VDPHPRETGPQYTELKSLVRAGGLHTVCEEAGCPNIYECWEDREATFLIGGEQCTRRCDFCQIDTGKPADLDRDEPRRVAESVAQMGLRYSTVTGVARDDLPDGGAWLYAETVRQIHQLNPGTGVELLIPDFNSRDDQLAEVFGARPEVLAHNLETVPRIFKRIRPAFRYDRSLEVLTKARAAGLVTKSNLILGMGETPDEVTAASRTCTTPAARSSRSPSTCARRPAPPGRAVGQARGVRGALRGGHRDGLRRRDGRAAGALVLPRRSALRPDGRARGERLPGGLEHLAAEGPAAQEASSLLARG